MKIKISDIIITITQRKWLDPHTQNYTGSEYAYNQIGKIEGGDIDQEDWTSEGEPTRDDLHKAIDEFFNNLEEK